jgi:myo-inositol-hexaphosphate 3-phosphohydrolase
MDSSPELFTTDDGEYEKVDNTNFKFVKWADIAKKMGLKINKR